MSSEPTVNSAPPDVTYAAKRLAIRHVQDVRELDDIEPLIRRQFFAEVDRATERLWPADVDDFRATYQAEFDYALAWVRQQREERTRFIEAQRVEEEMSQFRLDHAELRQHYVFRELEVLRPHSEPRRYVVHPEIDPVVAIRAEEVQPASVE